MSDSNLTYSPIPVNNQIALFDYDALDTETRIVVRQRTEEIKTLMRRTAQDIIDIGSKLNEVRGRLSQVRTGTYQSWLKSEFDWSYPLAAKFINVFEQFNAINFIALDVAPSALYLLAAPSTPMGAREEAIERAQTGETITHAKAQEIVAEHKSPTPSIRYVPTVDTSPIDDVGLPESFDPDEEEEITALDDLAYCPYCKRIHDGWRQISYQGRVIYGSACDEDEQDIELSPDEWEQYRVKEQTQPEFDLTPSPVVISPEPIIQENVPMPTNRAFKYSSESNEWYTPRPIIEKAINVMGGIDLDPASNIEANKTIQAARIYTIEDNALIQPWSGRVWLNPPYGNDIEPFVDKLLSSLSNGVPEALLLVAARTDTAWFRKLRDYARCFIWGRLKFINGETGEPGDPAGFPSMVVYMGPNIDKFIYEFQTIGDIYTWMGAQK